MDKTGDCICSDWSDNIGECSCRGECECHEEDEEVYTHPTGCDCHERD